MATASGFGLRLVAYWPDGGRVGPMPDVLEMTLTSPLNEEPTLTVSYPVAGGGRGDLLDGEIELAVEYTSDNGASWVEPPGARFITTKVERNLLADGTEARRAECVHISHHLQGALVWDPPKSAQDADGKWNFLSVNSGTIVRTVWDAAVARGWGKALTLRGSSSADAAGAKWKSIMTIAYDPTIDLLSLVKSLYDLGIMDYRWDGRTLSLFNNDTVMAASNYRVWRLFNGSSSAEETVTWQEMCTDVLVDGEGTNRWRFHNSEAPVGLRRTEKVVSAGGVEKEETARIIAQKTLVSGAHPEQEVKRDWDLGVEGVLLPWVDYQVGDWMRVERSSGLERLRVMQVSVTLNSSGISGHTTFGTVLEDYLSRLAKKTKGIAGLAATSGSGVRPSKPADRRVPAKPLGVVGSGVLVPTESGGGYYGAVRLTWAAVTVDNRGVAIDVREYRVACSHEVTGTDGTTRRVALPIQVVGPNSCDFPNLDPGVLYRFQVQAVSADGVVSEWSQALDVLMPTDVTPPPKPSKPSLSQRQGVLVVMWDGKSADGGGMPADLSYLNVGVKAPADGALVVRGSLVRGGQCILAGLPLNEPLSVALYAVDRTGNESGWGASESITLTAAVDPDVINKSVEEALKKGDALSKATRKEILDMFAKMGRSGDIIDSAWPPSRGVVGKSLWVSPDGRIFRCSKRGDKEE